MVIQELGGQFTLKKLQKLFQPQYLYKKIRQRILQKQYPESREREFFFGNRTPAFESNPQILKVKYINEPIVLKTIEKYSPDIVVVFGTSLLRGEILYRKNMKIVNLHSGITPNYRGADGVFWALYNRDFNNVGCTIHHIAAGIDTGDVIAQIHPEIKNGDDEPTILWRAQSHSADAYVEFLKRTEKGEEFGKKLENKGKLFLATDRGILKTIVLNNRLKRRLLQNVDIPFKIEWFMKNGR